VEEVDEQNIKAFPGFGYMGYMGCGGGDDEKASIKL
jgi:hypothetical protein